MQPMQSIGAPSSVISSTSHDVTTHSLSSLSMASKLPPLSPLSISRSADEITNMESVFASNTVLDVPISEPAMLQSLSREQLRDAVKGFLRRTASEGVRVTVTILSQIERYLIRRSSPLKFMSKFMNHAKGNFYISKPMIQRMMKECAERFDTDIRDDEKSAFGYYKESVAMQINDGQIDEVLETVHGDLLILINIDLHFAESHAERRQVMYLVAMENDAEFVDKVRWCIVDFMSAKQIRKKYGVSAEKLPRSSRQMPAFKSALNRPPTHVPVHVIYNTDFRHLPAKTSKRDVVKSSSSEGTDKTKKATEQAKTRISQRQLRHFVERSWATQSVSVPVVVIKGKKQWIEWKRFVGVVDQFGYRQSIGISLRYYWGNREWKIECMDYDAGRIYYQHRLVGPTKPHFQYTYNHLKGLITTQLDIYRQAY